MFDGGEAGKYDEAINIDSVIFKELDDLNILLKSIAHDNLGDRDRLLKYSVDEYYAEVQAHVVAAKRREEAMKELQNKKITTDG